MVEPASPTAGVDNRRDYALRTGAVCVGIDPQSAQVARRGDRGDDGHHGCATHERRGGRIITESPPTAFKATSLERHQPTRAKVTSGHDNAPRGVMSQARMAAAPTSYARHQAGHQAGTPVFSIKYP